MYICPINRPRQVELAECAANRQRRWHYTIAISATTATHFFDFLAQMATMAAAQPFYATANAAMKNPSRWPPPLVVMIYAIHLVLGFVFMPFVELSFVLAWYSVLLLP